MTKEEAIRKGFLQSKKVYLKPVVRGGGMITNPLHVAYFQYEGANNWFQLPINEKTNMLVNPFTSDEEKKYFEEILDLDLNVYKKKDNFWHTFFVKVIKDFNLMHDGYVFDLSDPIENLKWRVTKLQEQVAPDWDHKTSRGEYRFALVDEGYTAEQEQNSTNKTIEAYTYLGSMQNSIKEMRDFLGVYYLEKKMMNSVPSDSDKEWLRKEIGKIVEAEVDLALKIKNDPGIKVKTFILSGIRAGAIVKSARNKYDIPGEGVSYTYEELVKYLTDAEDIKADVYLKILSQIKVSK